MTESWHREIARDTPQLLLLAALVLDLAGISLLGAVDTVGRVETGAEHFLLSLTVAASHRLDDIVKIGDLLLLFAFHRFSVTCFYYEGQELCQNC